MTDRTCSIDGCEKAHNAKGFCGSHYNRWRNHGDPLGGGTTHGAAMAFIELTISNPPDDLCVIWPFSTQTAGYGQIWHEGRLQTAHRVCLELSTGERHDDMDAAHTPVVCHEPLCINPRHLRWATRSENHADKRLDDTNPEGESHYNAALTTPEVLGIRAAAGTQQGIASRYGISRGHVSSIKTRKTWKHI